MDLRFSQSTASPNFSKGGHTITSTIDDLKAGRITPDDLDSLKVVEVDGKLYSLDNRRLVAYQQAGVKDVPIQRVSLDDPNILEEFTSKFNPVNDGLNIVITPRKGRAAAEAVLREHGKIK